MEYHKQQFLTYDEFTRQFACDYAMPLARGGHGEIYRGVDLETNEEVAIKRRLYSVDDNALTLEKEYANTQAVPVNRFVVRYLYYGRYVTPFGTYEFLVMRYYRDGNLTNTALSWPALSNLQQQRFISEFLLGLSHLHTHGIVHRDIKPENVLLVRYSDSEGIAFRPVIVDFGISKMMTDYPEAARAFVQNSMRIGTVTYMAPEQLRTENIDYNADLWSFGIILYELITGKHMIARKSFPETQREEAYAFWRMANEENFPDDLRTVPQPYQQMIRKCLIVSPEERVPSARALLDLLELQPRIVDAERAFRRQKWEEVIEALEPIVDRADMPELAVWLQQARMQQALSQPINVLADEPQPAFGEAYTDKAVPDPEQATEAADDVPDVATPTPEPPAEDQLTKPVPYTAQTELLDEPTDPMFAPQEQLADIEEEPALEQQPEPSEPEPDTDPAEAAPYVPDVTETMPMAAVDETPAAVVDEHPVTDTPAVDEPVAEPAEAITYTNDLTETFPDEPTSTGLPPIREVDTNGEQPAETDAFTVPEQPVAASQPADEQSLVEDPQYTEAFADVPAIDHTQADAVSQPILPAGVGVNVPARKKIRIPSAATKLPEVVLPRLKETLTNFPTDRLKSQFSELYDRARRVKNRPLLVGGVVIGLLLLLFTVNPGKPSSAVVQLDPNESYAASLKRFQAYARTYEKTGDLNPYVWAFVHCNPVYDDSLVQSAVRRAETVRSQNQLIFPEYEGNLAGLKRLEMRYMLKDKILWEVRPHNLSDENCLPKK